MFFVYILKTRHGQLYVGCTRHLLPRLTFHARGTGAIALRGKSGLRIVYHEKYSTLKEARHRERQLKGWTRAKKEALIRRDFQALKRLSRRSPPLC